MPDQREELVRKMIAEGTSDDDILATLKLYDTQAPKGAMQTAKDVGVGVLKGAGSTLTSLGRLAGNAGVLPGVRPSAFDSDMEHPAFGKADELTTASNDAQRAGKVVEGVAEMALPTGAAIKAVPRTARAAMKFQRVAQAANKVPVNIEAPGQIALRIQELADRGATAPRVVSKFLRRVTDPSQAAMPFEEGRDFYSNISRLSADEYNRLTGPIKREVGNLKGALDRALQQAAGTVGQGAEYGSAMREYAQAAKLRSAKDALVTALKRGALPMAGAAGAGYWLGNKLSSLAGSMFED